MDYLQQQSACAACNRGRGDVWILPCSHTMCVQCIAAGGGTGSGLSVRPPVCTVLCPRCRQAVELPCLDRSSATSCLPKHPTLASPRVSQLSRQQEASERGSGDRTERVQGSQGKASDESRLCSMNYDSPLDPLEGAVELLEEEMERSVFGLCFALDPSAVPSSLRLSNFNLTVLCTEEFSHEPAKGRSLRRGEMTSVVRVRRDMPTVRGDVVIKRGQYYWEVDVYNSSVYRLGVSSLDGSEHWCLDRHGGSFTALYDGSRESLWTVPPQIKTVGVFLNITGGALSFHNTLTHERLLTLPTRFGRAGVLPILGVGQGQLRLRSSLPPPPHVFISRDSCYRRPGESARAGKQKVSSLQSVKKLIQKFEELAVSESD